MNSLISRMDSTRWLTHLLVASTLSAFGSSGSTASDTVVSGNTQVLAVWGATAGQTVDQCYSGKGMKIGGGAFNTGAEVLDCRHPNLAWRAAV